MGTKLFIHIITGWVLVAMTTGQQLRDCSRSEYNRCIGLADPLLKEPHLIFPDNMADIELVCLTWNQFVDCLKSYTDRCFTPQQRKQFNKAVENPIESVHQMCTQTSYQQEYLQHATCIKSTVTQPQHCGDQYSQLVDQVSQGEAISRASLCCTHDRFRRCVTIEARRICDRGVPNGNAVRFAEQIIDKALSFLQDQCYNYIPNSGDCLSPHYKSSDDQLAMSTSPWFSTKTGQTSAELDAMSTGVSILDMSSPPVGNPGYSRQPGLQAVDTKVTDVSWLPSITDTDGSSTGFKDTQGSTYGGSTMGGGTPGGSTMGGRTPGGSTMGGGNTGGSTMGAGTFGGSTMGGGSYGGSTMGGDTPGGSTRPDGTSGTSLGSRTRPSSYGRSSGWDTSPTSTPTPTPPARPDWATMSTWHVYNTENRETNSNNYSPFGQASSVNADPKPQSTLNNHRVTTETWYPAAGSHVGNEVDEPNQLGLSKPKNSAAPKIVAIELSLTMVATVLVALC